MIVYTFRTCHFLGELQEVFGEVFVFGKLKEDLEKLKLLAADQKPRLILGVAPTDRHAQYEPLAINRFGPSKIIAKDGPRELKLHPVTGFGPSIEPTSAFCNWTMYRLALFLNQELPATQLSFVHATARDISLLQELEQ